ncbi:hypothetical protein H8L32_04440 [Undibacterium sp. CY18W]|uniref:Uncharacterized protein n=1 Tax=Undibacterium hunanense TaxID=2762292 RepID=A0ABR6ZLC7_9BURK|nr:hypothetical protein [Undibacterium hunanense]MBC3916713.1 hypothetical protein [Undibacterium hunanense]
MTSRDTDINDIDPMQDAEFEEFLQGKGALADLLHELPQDTPSAALDAAILADAEAALDPHLRLAASEVPMIQAAILAPQPTLPVQPVLSPLAAANDVQNPDASSLTSPSSQKPSFLWRWKLPLGLAASVLLAVPFVLLQKNQQDTYPQLAKNEVQLQVPEERKAATVVAAAPMADMDSAAANIPAQSPRKPAGSVKAKSRLMDKDNTVVAMNRPEPVAPVVAQVAAVPAAATIAIPVPPAAAIAAEPVIVASATPDALRRAIPAAPAAAMSAAEVSSLAKMAANAASDDKQAAGGQAERARTFATGSVAMKEEVPRQYLRANEAETKPAIPQTSMDTRMAKSAAPLSAPAMAAMKSSVEKQLADNSNNVAMPAPVATAPPPMVQTPPVAAPVSDAQLRLAKIEKLIKAKQNKTALEEWNRFRTVYPDYVVDLSLQKQIENLQK